MSVKAQALVWDLVCPGMINGVAFRPSHKYALIAYADHADHAGKNIYPAVPTISRKTGLDDRTVQRLTHDLECMGLLIEDGMGPKGTNKWKLPFNAGGDRLSPVALRRGDKNDKSLGDIPSGDIPSGDMVTPELKEPEPLINLSTENEPGESAKIWDAVKEQLKSQMPRNNYQTQVEDTQALRYDGNALTVGVVNESAQAWLESRLTSTVERLLIGILNTEVSVIFVVSEMADA